MIPPEFADYSILTPLLKFEFNINSSPVSLKLPPSGLSIIGVNRCVCSNSVLVSNPQKHDINTTEIAIDTIVSLQNQINAFNTECWYSVNRNNNQIVVILDGGETQYTIPPNNYTKVSFLEAWNNLLGNVIVATEENNRFVFRSATDFALRDILTQDGTNSIYTVLGFLNKGATIPSTEGKLIATTFSLLPNFRSYQPPPFQIDGINSPIFSVDSSSLATFYNSIIALDFQNTTLTPILSAGYYRLSSSMLATDFVFDFANNENSVFVLYFPEPITIVNNSTIINGGSHKNILWISPEIRMKKGTTNIGSFLSNRIVNEGATLRGGMIATEEIIFTNSSSFEEEETNYIIQEESIQTNHHQLNFRVSSSSFTLQSPYPLAYNSSEYISPNNLFPFCMNPCQPQVIIKPQNSSTNNSTITKAMRYSQYIRNSQNKKTIFL